MRTISAGLFISLDGVVEARDQSALSLLQRRDGRRRHREPRCGGIVILFGRKTYDSFAGAWPEREAAGGEDAPFAKRLGNTRKIVVSRQRLVGWRNSEQLDGDLVDAVTALKNEPGQGSIGMSGSVSVVRQLLAPRLLDESTSSCTRSRSGRACGSSTRASRRSPPPGISGDLQDRCALPRLRPRRARRSGRLRDRERPSGSPAALGFGRHERPRLQRRRWCALAVAVAAATAAATCRGCRGDGRGGADRRCRHWAAGRCVGGRRCGRPGGRPRVGG